MKKRGDRTRRSRDRNGAGDARPAPAASDPSTFRPMVIGLALLALVAGFVLLRGLALTEGQLTYALDDSYVHLAMAKNVVEHGVWGVTRHEFSSSSSSPLWTLLLSGVFLVTGPRDAVPLVLNLIFAVGVLWTCARLLARVAGGESDRSSGAGRAALIAAALAVVILLVPFSALIATGQEHMLHLWLVLLFAQSWMGRLKSSARGIPVALLLITVAMVAVRYESLFLILIAALWLIRRRGLLEGALLVLAAALPVVLYGWISVSQGWLFFPNSMLLKANLPTESAGQAVKTLTGLIVLRRLLNNPHLLLLLIAALLLRVRLLRAKPQAEQPRAGADLTVLFVGATLLHVALADVGWFYRYEAYLVGLGLLTLAVGWLELSRGGETGDVAAQLRPPGRWALLLAIVLAAAGLGDRAVRATLEAPRAMANIYEQQIQMGRFLRDYYPGAVVAVNDIGAVNYLADIHCVDLVGLAHREVATLRRTRSYHARALERLLQDEGVQIAIVYDNWLRIPGGWQPLGQWRIQHNVVTGGDTVTLYAVGPGEAARLDANLRRFAPRLPRTVLQAGPYMDG